MYRTVSLLSFPLLLTSLAAQQLLHQGFGAIPNGLTGERIAAGGDLDGDQVPDLVVASAGNPVTFRIISGATGSVRTLVAQYPHILGVARDMNLDGAADLLTSFNGNLRAISGLTLTQLWQTPVSYSLATSIDDRDGDGRYDIAAITFGSTTELRILRGSDGSILTQVLLPWSSGSNDVLLSVGDVTGDGVPELAWGNTNWLRVLRFSVSPLLFEVNEPAVNIAAANFLGDARNEILIGANSTVKVLSSTNGAVLRTFGAQDGRFALLGDLNSDGTPDLATRGGSWFGGQQGADIVSGATGAMLSVWPPTLQLQCERLVGLGDVDGDGFGDLAIADTMASVTGSSANRTGGWQIVSGKILAFRESKPTNCAQGPFLPTIGMTLPKLGQVATIAGQDAPTGSVGLVAFSLKPSIPVNLGVFGCDAWFDLGGGSLLQTTTTTTWQFGLPIPPLPQLAGVGIALQAVYAPSNTAIGLDLSNGLWARVGF